MTYPIKIDLPEASVALFDITDDQPGYTRARLQGSEVFLDEDGELIEDDDILDRLEGLSIPPAWEDVWICADEYGYLQCTGRDAQQRKQYIYHMLWHEHRAAQKYERIEAFGAALPELRARYDADLRQRKPTRDRVSALGCAIIDRTAMRVGHTLYTKTHGSHGLTTLHKSHCTVGSSVAHFEFIGKSGVQRHVKMRDRRLCYQLKKLLDLPGDYLFQYESSPTPARLHAEHINAYISEECGEEMSAKCFRTWHGSVRAFDALTAAPYDDLLGVDEQAQAARKARVKHAIEVAAAFLGNTTSVCRAHYVHSALLDAVQDGLLWEIISELPVPEQLTMSEQERRLLHVLEHL